MCAANRFRCVASAGGRKWGIVSTMLRLSGPKTDIPFALNPSPPRARKNMVRSPMGGRVFGFGRAVAKQPDTQISRVSALETAVFMSVFRHQKNAPNRPFLVVVAQVGRPADAKEWRAKTVGH